MNKTDEVMDDKEAPQTPEEREAIIAANKARARNINKIFASLMLSLTLVFVIFLATYIPWRKHQLEQQTPPTTATVQVVTPTATSAPAPAQ